ncbi:MAG: beta-lactamase family protein [Bacteroidia bacterium]|nr:beta-lactamase family protein [Bacteroidia bacterium]
MNRIHLIYLLLLLAGMALSACKTTNDGSGQDASQVELAFLKDNPGISQALDSMVINDQIPFVYARIEALNGKTLYEHSKVNNELYPGLEVNKDSWFRIWSMSKILTITVALDLIEEGKLSFDEPIGKYIPEFSKLEVAMSAEGKPLADYEYEKGQKACPMHMVQMEEEMTVRHLINHEAGFYYPWTSISCLDSIWRAQNLNAAKNTDELIQRMKNLPLVQQPGHSYYYGLNTTVLGMLVEKATGQSLKQLVVDRITGPLKIEGLQYGKPDEVTLLPRTSGGKEFIKITEENESQIFGAELPDYSQESELYLGGEGMLATTDGYADFLRMLLQRGKLNGYRLLEESTIVDMSSPHTQKNSPWGHNGYNLWVTGDTLRKMGTGEAGLWVVGGYEGTYAWVDTKRKFVGIVMTQMFNMPTGPSEIFRKAVYQELWKEENKID